MKLPGLAPEARSSIKLRMNFARLGESTLSKARAVAVNSSTLHRDPDAFREAGSMAIVLQAAPFIRETRGFGREIPLWKARPQTSTATVIRLPQPATSILFFRTPH